jgi:hypothetical protein
MHRIVIADTSFLIAIQKMHLFDEIQDPPGIYECGHAAMEDFRGRELGVKEVEGFVRMMGKREVNVMIS